MTLDDLCTSSLVLVKPPQPVDASQPRLKCLLVEARMKPMGVPDLVCDCCDRTLDLTFDSCRGFEELGGILGVQAPIQLHAYLLSQLHWQL